MSSPVERSQQPDTFATDSLLSGSEHRFAAEGPGELAVLRDEMEHLLGGAGFDQDQQFDVSLAVTELLTNAFEHGRSNLVSVILEIDTEEVFVRVEHSEPEANRPNFAKHSGAKSLPISGSKIERGRGLGIVVAVASAFDQWTTDDGRLHSCVTFGRTRDE